MSTELGSVEANYKQPPQSTDKSGVERLFTQMAGNSRAEKKPAVWQEKIMKQAAIYKPREDCSFSDLILPRELWGTPE